MGPSRNDPETMQQRTCPIDGRLFQPVGRRQYCSDACRQAAWRQRQQPTPPAQLLALERSLPAALHRRDVTVYSCPECDERYLGQQWCHDCVRPCLRTGIGGRCPDCEHPVAVDELLAQHNTQTDQTGKIR